MVCGIYRRHAQGGGGVPSWCSIEILGVTLRIGSEETGRVEKVLGQPTWSSTRFILKHWPTGLWEPAHSEVREQAGMLKTQTLPGTAWCLWPQIIFLWNTSVFALENLQRVERCAPT